MKLLIVGGAGYVGRIICPSLEQFHTCRHFDLVPVQGSSSPTMIGDVNDPAAVANAVAGMEVLVYLAMGSLRQGTPREVQVDNSFDVNVKGYFRVMTAALKAGVRRVVLASSLSTHLRDERKTRWPMDESSPADALDSYGLSKRIAEFMNDAFAREHPDATFLAMKLFWPRSDQDWPGNEYKPNRRSHPLGPHDMRRLFLAAVDLSRPGSHLVNATGDLGGDSFSFASIQELLGWRPEGR